MRAFLLVAGIALAGLSAAASPQAGSDLAAAIRAGQVGERYDGYLGFAATPPAAVQRQVGAINIRRRVLYVDLARRRNVAPQVVAIATGCERLKDVAVGEAYMLSDGVWRRRRPGEPPPQPAYCG